MRSEGLFVCTLASQVKIDGVLRTKFVKCDTTNWEDQLEMFRTAAGFSDDGRISYVVANAGIARADELFSYSGTVPDPDQSLWSWTASLTPTRQRPGTL